MERIRALLGRGRSPVAEMERVSQLAQPPVVDLRLVSDLASVGDRNGGDVISCGVLWAPRWDRLRLEALRAVVGDGRLWFVEPVPASGWRGRVQRGLSRLWRGRYGHDHRCDVPAELRAAGFMVVTVDRFAVGRGRLRLYAAGEAVVDRVRFAPLHGRGEEPPAPA